MNKILPPTIQAAATLDTTVALADHQAPEWTLTVHLRGPAVINLAAAAAGQLHRFGYAADTTQGWTPGLFQYVARATRVADGWVDQVDEGQVEILRDLAAVDSPADLRSDARKGLDAIEAVLLKRASMDQMRYTINGRELWRTAIADLLKLKGHYQALVRREAAKARGTSLWRPAARVRF